ncbi:unnamed protein product, partial [Protopolystoma xenopodis]
MSNSGIFAIGICRDEEVAWMVCDELPATPFAVSNRPSQVGCRVAAPVTGRQDGKAARIGTDVG